MVCICAALLIEWLMAKQLFHIANAGLSCSINAEVCEVNIHVNGEERKKNRCPCGPLSVCLATEGSRTLQNRTKKEGECNLWSARHVRFADFNCVSDRTTDYNVCEERKMRFVKEWSRGRGRPRCVVDRGCWLLFTRWRGLCLKNWMKLRLKNRKSNRRII